MSFRLPTHVGDESIASFLSRVPKQKDPEKQLLLENQQALKDIPPLKCYYCTKKDFRSKIQYEKHVVRNHSKPAYPNLPYLEDIKIEPQNCIWEK